MFNVSEVAVKQPEVKRFYGYVVDLKVRVLSDSIVYYVTLVDLGGNEVVVRTRVLPEWLRVGSPISGELVKVVAGRETYLTLREPQAYSGLKIPRVVKARNIHLEQITGLRRWVIHGENVEGGPVSYPILSNTVVERARKTLGAEEVYLYVADTPSGSVVITVQSAGQHNRYERFEKFLKWIENSK